MAISRRSVLRGGLAAIVLPGCSAPPAQEIPPAAAPAMRVVTFNIRYLDLTAQGRDGTRGIDAWHARRPLVLAALTRLDADIIGFQEMESWDGTPQADPPLQRHWLTEQMPGYGVAAAWRDGRETGQPIFFRRRRFTLLDEGREALADTPGYARAAAGYSDTVTWARLRDRVTGKGVTVLNLHLNLSDALRRESGALVARGLAERALAGGDRVVVLGDFNAGVHSLPVRQLEASGLAPVPSRGASFHFNGGLDFLPAIDHILHGPRLRARGPARMFRGQSRGLWPSDHYPVWADLHPV